MTDSQSETTPAASRRQSRRRNRRKQLISASRELFLSHGFSETSVSAIVRAAGVAQGTFYLYFQSKADVLLYMRAEVLQDYLAVFERAFASEEPADVRLVAGIEAIQEAVDRNRPMIRVFREATTSDELSRVWIEGREALAAPLSALMAAGVADGSFRLEDPRMSAMLTLSFYDDLLYEALEYETPAPPAQTLLASATFVLRGLGVSEGRIGQLLRRPLTEGTRSSS